MLNLFDDDDHFVVFHVDVNDDLLYYYCYYYYYHPVFLHHYVDVYDYFHYFHLYLIYEIHWHRKNVDDLQQQNANVVVYVILNDFSRYIATQKQVHKFINDQRNDHTIKPRPFTGRPLESIFFDRTIITRPKTNSSEKCSIKKLSYRVFDVGLLSFKSFRIRNLCSGISGIS